MTKFFKKLLQAMPSLTHHSHSEDVDKKPDVPRKKGPAPYTSPINERSASTSPVRRRLLFLLLGSTGAGKTTFIDLALSKEGAGTHTCLDQIIEGVKYQRVRHPNDPEVELILVDTPGLGVKVTPNDIRKALAKSLASPEAATFSNAEFGAILWIEQIGLFVQPGLQFLNPMLGSCLKDPDLRNRVLVLTNSEAAAPEDRLQLHRERLSEKLLAARTDSKPTTIQHVDMTSDSVWKVLNGVMKNSRDEMDLGALRRFMEKK